MVLKLTVASKVTQSATSIENTVLTNVKLSLDQHIEAKLLPEPTSDD